jgi:hypothetical protein
MTPAMVPATASPETGKLNAAGNTAGKDGIVKQNPGVLIETPTGTVYVEQDMDREMIVLHVKRRLDISPVVQEIPLVHFLEIAGVVLTQAMQHSRQVMAELAKAHIARRLQEERER